MKFLALIIAFTFALSSFAMERTIATGQRAVRAVSVKISSAGVKSGLDKYQVVSSRTSTGTYDITFSKSFSRDVTAIPTQVAATCAVKTITETNAKVTIVMAAADHTTVKDCDFNLLVFGSDTTEAY